MQFNDDEIETIKGLLNDRGHDCCSVDYDKVKELEYKLGVSVRPTAEEIAEYQRRRKEFNESNLSKSIAELLTQANNSLNCLMATIAKENKNE